MVEEGDNLPSEVDKGSIPEVVQNKLGLVQEEDIHDSLQSDLVAAALDKDQDNILEDMVVAVDHHIAHQLERVLGHFQTEFLIDVKLIQMHCKV